MLIEPNKIYNTDCLEGMKYISNKSVDMILCDLPYGLGKCKWDTVINIEDMWENYNRIIKDDGAIVLFSQQPFTSNLIMSNLQNYKYEYIWVKNKINGFLNAKLAPTKKFEEILVFSKAKCSNGAKLLMKYNPQGLIKIEKKIKNANREGSTTYSGMTKKQKEYKQEYTNYPSNILYFDCETNISHPTQKPVDLLEHLIKTYTNEGDLVLDNCMGSGSTIVACLNTNRQFIGMELDNNYFEIAKERIENLIKDKVISI